MITSKLRGDDVQITPKIKDYVYRHVGQLSDYLTDRTSAVANVNLMGLPKNKIKAEVTVSLPYFSIRGEGSNEDVFKAIDRALNEIKHEIKTFGDQVNDELQANGNFPAFFPSKTQHSLEFKIVRKKWAVLDEMTAEQAILQMNLLAHDFYIYEDIDDNCVNLVYKRNDGNYGVIKTNVDISN